MATRTQTQTNEAQINIRPHLRRHSASVSYVPAPCIPNPLTQEEFLISQLAHLASQHHCSDYNQIKFGPQGCPTIYIPLTVQMPEFVNEQQARQNEYNTRESWWPCDHSKPSTETSSSLDASSPSDLQQEISEAMSALLDPPSPKTPTPPQSDHTIKTSASHPINVSTIIPADILPLISSHLTPMREPSPVMFDIHPSYSLDRVTTCIRSLHISNSTSFSRSHALPPPLPATPSPKIPELHRPPPNNSKRPSKSTPSPTLGVKPIYTRTRSFVTEAIQAAISSGIAVTTISNSESRAQKALQKLSMPIPRRGRTPSISVAEISPPTLPNQDDHMLLRSTSAPPSSISLPYLPMPPPPLPLKVLNGQHKQNSEKTAESDLHLILPLPNIPPTSPILKLSILRPTQVPKFIFPGSNDSQTPFSLGNILLSSCPGKKVRLNGPIKGRGAVCRDLHSDLSRIRALGVRCIICCLDDEELDFLGAPWPQYCTAANSLGIDVLRIPTPEGLTPISPESLDTHLTTLIKRYTLNGVPMLIHCRGGVGRAGLVACCWALKLGLCGWIETDLRLQNESPTPSMQPGGTILVRRDTMQLVERVISVMRKRRSVKAVETYEQVKFLVSYVDYLRERQSTLA